MIEAVCTWGYGPDVIVNFKDHGFILYEKPKYERWANGCVKNGSCDLTAKEAEELGYKLIEAARQARSWGESAENYFELERRNDEN